MMIQFTEETLKQFCTDVEFANKVLADLTGRIITEFWRESVPVIRREVFESYEIAGLVEGFKKKHPSVSGIDWERVSALKDENPNISVVEALDRFAAEERLKALDQWGAEAEAKDNSA